MAQLYSTTQFSEAKSRTSPRPQTPSRLRKRLTKGSRSSGLLGVSIKRISEFESYSGRSRGTLGGFRPLGDVRSPDVDSISMEREKCGVKECVLTHLTKRIGLGIYTRARDVTAQKGLREGYVDLDDDERETWYMFYPPPPSPSLVLESKDWDSASSLETDCNSNSISVPNLVSRAGFEPDGQPGLSAINNEDIHVVSNPGSPIGDYPNPNHENERQNVDIDALTLSAENFAEQYRDLLLPDSPRPCLIRSHSDSGCQESVYPFLSTFSFLAPIATPKTIRKVKRQHSLRKLIDAKEPRNKSTTISLASVTPPASIQAPDFLSTTLSPAPLHPSRLSLAAHPNRSPTPNRRPKAKAKSKSKKSQPRRDLSQPQGPPPRSSSRDLTRSAKRSKSRGDPPEAGTQGLSLIGAEEEVGDRAIRRGRQRSREWRRYGVVEMVPGEIEDGVPGGWV